VTGNLGTGGSYLWRGLQLLRQPALRPYVAIPLLLNLLIFGFLIGMGFEQFSTWIDRLLSVLPDWLHFLRWILWPLSMLLLLVVAMYCFSIVANLIAAPFNGLLAERAEALLTGAPAEGGGFAAALRDAPRAIGKELRKTFYYLPRALLVLLCSLIPPLYPLAPLLWFLLGAWMMALEYCDYPMDNHRYSLRLVRQQIARERLTSLGFGGAVMLGTMVPLLNFLIMPAAVCGATIYWVERMRLPPPAR
jgi:CysZ protein